MVFCITTSVIILSLWRKHPRYWPAYSVLLFYQIHRVLFYTVLLVSHASPISAITSGLLNDWSAIVTWHAAATWLFITLMVCLWLRGGQHDR